MMRNLLVIVFACLMSAAVAEARDLGYARPYAFVDKGEVDFADIGTLQITRIDGTRVLGVITESVPSLELAVDTIYAYPFTGTLKKGHLSIVTETVPYRHHPSSYRFEGMFTRALPYDSILNNREVVLKGRLTFYSKGILLAEAPVTLAPYGLRALTEDEIRAGK